MSNLLALLISPQSSTNVSGGSGIASESSTHVKQGQSTPLQQATSPAFAQVLRELHERLPFQGTVTQSTPIDGQADDEPVSLLTSTDLESSGEVLAADSRETLLGESHVSGFQSQDVQALATRPSQGQDRISDLSRLIQATVNDGTLADDQLDSIQASPQPGTVSTVAHTPFIETQVLASAGVHRQGLQSTDGARASGAVGQVRGPNPPVPESVGVVPHVSLSKVLEVGATSPQGEQGADAKRTPFLSHQDGEQGGRTPAPFGKDGSFGLSQTNKSIQHNEPLTLSNPPQVTQSKTDLHPVQQHRAPLAHVISPAGLAGFSQIDSIGQLTGRPIPASASTVNDLSNSVIENRTTLQVDPLGDTGLLNKGDRSQTVIDASTKIVGLDAGGGQGLGSGMNFSQNSQAGYQQSSTLPAQGIGVRGLEERAVDVPAPALQRLQMDVQLSETQRVSIDVGVQNRQVYAGLVTDHAILRNLATQFVPQLENQLADVDMELQEFSAEVREERQQQDEAMFHHRSFTGHRIGGSSQQESHEPQTSLNRQDNARLHLVA